MTRIEKRFVNDVGHSRRVAEEAVRRLRHLPIERGWSYLDVGCGNGAAALLVADTFGMRVVGVDVEAQQIALARAAFGPVSGATTLLVAMTIAACIQFLLARHVVGARVRQRLGHALARVNELIEGRGVLAVAGARLLPGPFSEFNMLAGLTLLKLRDFTIGTVIGCTPKALVWSGLGALLF